MTIRLLAYLCKKCQYMSIFMAEIHANSWKLTASIYNTMPWNLACSIWKDAELKTNLMGSIEYSCATLKFLYNTVSEMVFFCTYFHCFFTYFVVIVGSERYISAYLWHSIVHWHITHEYTWYNEYVLLFWAMFLSFIFAVKLDCNWHNITKWNTHEIIVVKSYIFGSHKLLVPYCSIFLHIFRYFETCPCISRRFMSIHQEIGLDK